MRQAKSCRAKDASEHPTFTFRTRGSAYCALVARATPTRCSNDGTDRQAFVVVRHWAKTALDQSGFRSGGRTTTEALLFVDHRNGIDSM
jgi:hypothetical protein